MPLGGFCVELSYIFLLAIFSPLVNCQVYYHLGAFEDSVTYALGAGTLFNVNATTEYVETIVGEFADVIFLRTHACFLSDIVYL